MGKNVYICSHLPTFADNFTAEFAIFSFYVNVLCRNACRKADDVGHRMRLPGARLPFSSARRVS